MLSVECGGGNAVFSSVSSARRNYRRRNHIPCFRRSRRRTKACRKRRRCFCRTKRCARIQHIALAKSCFCLSVCCRVHSCYIAPAKSCCGKASRCAHIRHIALAKHCCGEVSRCARARYTALDTKLRGCSVRCLENTVLQGRNRSAPRRRMPRWSQTRFRIGLFGFSHGSGIRCNDRCPCFLLCAGGRSVPSARIHCCIMNASLSEPPGRSQSSEIASPWFGRCRADTCWT